MGGAGRAERLVGAFALSRRTVHFPLHPGVGREGKRLQDVVPGIVDVERAHARLAGIAAAEGLPFTPPPRVWDSRLAQELASWAAGRGVPLDAALFRAVWVEGRNVGDEDVLVAIAQEAGLEAEAARAVLTGRTAREAVDADWAFARKVGVTGVPTYAIGGRGVVGAQPYEVLEGLAETSGVPRR
ncbi:MAG: DsbA family protein [Myxococcota bacterium]